MARTAPGIDAGGMGGRRLHGEEVVRLDGGGGDRRGSQLTLAVQSAQGRESAFTGRGFLRIGGGACGLFAGDQATGGGRHVGQPLEHFNEQAGKRQVRPVGIGGNMEQHHQPLAFGSGSHKRGAVLEAGPDARRQRGGGFGQHLALHLDGRIGGQTGERRVFGKRGQRLRLFPAQRRAECTAARAQFHRHQPVMAAGQAGAGKAHQHAATRHPPGEGLDVAVTQHAKVCQDQHGRAVIECLGDLVDRFHLGDLGAGLKRARHIVERRQQRLVEFERCARNHGHGLAPPAVVEQVDAACGALCRQFHAGGLVAQFERQFHRHLGCLFAGRELQHGISQRAAVQRPDTDRFRRCSSCIGPHS